MRPNNMNMGALLLMDKVILQKNSFVPEQKYKQFLTLITLIKKKRIKGKIRLFIIVNEGIHPILPALRQKYGDQINYKILTAGNVDLSQERTIAKKCKEIAEQYHDYEVFLVPGGYSYLSLTAYNVLHQSMGRHPVWLQYDPGQKDYVEKRLNPRELLNDGET